MGVFSLGSDFKPLSSSGWQGPGGFVWGLLQSSSGRRDRSRQWGVCGGVWSKMGKGEVARTVGPFGRGALTPTYFCPQSSEEGALPWCSLRTNCLPQSARRGQRCHRRSLSQLLASAVCHPSQKWAGREERMSPPMLAPEAGGREEYANICGSVHRFPRIFRDEGGPLPVAGPEVVGGVSHCSQGCTRLTQGTGREGCAPPAGVRTKFRGSAPSLPPFTVAFCSWKDTFFP